MLNKNSFGSAARFCVALAMAASACGGDDSGSADSTALNAADARMKEGLTLLYEKGDAFGAEAAFRDVLKAKPSHYGAHFQLAQAIDREGKPTEARPLWEAMLKSADSIKDTSTARMVRARLALPDTVGIQGMMALGMNYSYKKNDPVAAADLFRKVLEKSPNHYGATYQLAAALDKAGKRAEAKTYWEKTLAMATTYKDAETAATAKAKLSQAR